MADKAASYQTFDSLTLVSDEALVCGVLCILLPAEWTDEGFAVGWAGTARKRMGH